MTNIAPHILSSTLFYHLPPFPLHCVPSSHSLLALFTDLPAYGLACSSDYALLLLVCIFYMFLFLLSCAYPGQQALTLKSHLPSQHQLLQLCNICVHSSLSSVLLLTISFAESDFPSGKFLLILGKAFLNSTTEAKLCVSLFCFSVFMPVSWLLFFYVTLISIICSVFNFSFNVYFPLELSIYLFIHYKLIGT